LWRATREVDVVHAHGLRAGLVSAMAGRRPLVVTWHNLVLTPAGLRRRPLVVSVGRLHRLKGYETLIAAAARWTALQVLVVVAGGGPDEDALRTLIADRRAPVRLLGRRTDVPDLLAAADVVVLTSRWEARSLVAQEALLLGRPLV